MSLLTYAGAALGPLRETKVTNREIPPWHIDRSIGEYANDVSLSVGKWRPSRRGWTAARREGNLADATGESVPAEQRVDLR